MAGVTGVVAVATGSVGLAGGMGWTAGACATGGADTGAEGGVTTGSGGGVCPTLGSGLF